MIPQPVIVTVGQDVPGDLDGDRHVDLIDLALLQGFLGRTGGATAAQGDLNGDGQVTRGDVAMFARHFGTRIAGSPAAPAPSAVLAATSVDRAIESLPSETTVGFGRKLRARRMPRPATAVTDTY